MENYVKEVVAVFKMNADATNARHMKAYLKNKVDFLGLKTPLREELSKPFLQKENLPKEEDLTDVVSQLWAYPYRELHYFALRILEKQVKHLGEPYLFFTEGLAQEKSWWDTIDFLSTRIIGEILKNKPAQWESYAMRWSAHPNFWVNRIALLFQLKYKENTDFNLLTQVIEQHKGSSEFFIQKAIGWALREYSKTDARTVSQFVYQTKLKNLSQREALRLIKAGKVN